MSIGDTSKEPSLRSLLYFSVSIWSKALDPASSTQSNLSKSTVIFAARGVSHKNSGNDLHKGGQSLLC